jgi:hypothetical protein
MHGALVSMPSNLDLTKIQTPRLDSHVPMRSPRHSRVTFREGDPDYFR